MPRFLSIRTAIPAWTPKHLQTCWPNQKRISQNRSARQKRRNSAHLKIRDRRHHSGDTFYLMRESRISRHAFTQVSVGRTDDGRKSACLISQRHAKDGRWHYEWWHH